MNFRYVSYRLAVLVLFVSTVFSCSIEKRKYTSGFHVEWNRNTHRERTIATNEESEPGSDVSVADETKATALPIVSDNEGSVSTFHTISEASVVEQISHKAAENITTGETTYPDISPEKIEITGTKISAEVHPHAFASLLCGIVAAGSLLTMFLLSFSPAALVAALLVSIIVFSLLAIRLAKSANSDMYYARNRYSGRGLSSAGMVLGIVTLVALIGFIAVLGITVVFGAFA